MIPHPFPVALDLRGRDALVVGSDADAIERARRLARAGARVRVLVRGEAPAALCTLAEHECVHIEAREALPEDLTGAAVIYVATSEEAQAPALFARALATGQPLCTVDRPELSTFISPAVVEVGSLAIAVSTGGASPALARRIREDLTALFSDPRFAPWLAALAEEREALPRGERAARGMEAVAGFAIEGRLSLPASAEEGARALATGQGAREELEAERSAEQGAASDAGPAIPTGRDPPPQK